MKTAEVFKKIPKSKLEQFLSYLGNQSTTKSARLVQITSALIKNISAQHITKDLLLEQLPDYKNHKNLQKDLHDILNKLLFFLSMEELKHEPILNSKMRIKAIDRYSLSEIALKEYNELEQSVKKIEDIDNDLNIDKYLFTKLKFAEKNNIIGRSIRPDESLIHEIHQTYDNLTVAYYIELFKLKQFLDSSRRAIHSQSDINLPELKPHVDLLSSSLLLQLHYKTYSVLTNPNPNLDEYNWIVDELGSNKLISKKEFETLLTNLSNSLVRQSNLGVKEFDTLHLKLHKIAIARHHYDDNFNTILYRNIIRLACDEKEFSWALQFSEEYKFKLPEEEQETAYSFNKARIFQNMGSYEKVVETLRDVEYKDITYNLNSKLMLMGAFYELNEYETLISTIRAFKVFLRRRRNISVRRKANFTDFSDALYNIIIAEENKDVKRVQKARIIIQANPAIPNTSWLEQKIDAVGLS